MKATIELYPAEGGDDSKLFIQDLAQSYLKLAQRFGWIAQLQKTEASIQIKVSGEDLTKLKMEAGAHRLQRIPPTERKGRVHTSTATVAVLFDGETSSVTIRETDFKIEWYSGTGAGGQHRNKHQNSIRLTHIPTGLIETAQCRSREASYKQAMDNLSKRLQSQARTEKSKQLSSERRQQLGNGSNSNVVRHYCFQHGFVKNNDGAKMSIEQFHKGMLDLLW